MSPDIVKHMPYSARKNANIIETESNDEIVYVNMIELVRINSKRKDTD